MSTSEFNPDIEIPLEEMSYEQAFSALEKIVTTLESNKLPLEEALNLFERGQEIIRYCMLQLEQAELKVRRLSNTDLVDLDAQA